MAASAASNASVIYMLETHGHRLLFTGDVEDSDTNRLAKTSLKDKHVDVFLATHHGSTHGTTEPLFEAITSTNAVLPVGENSYKHPTVETIVRLRAAKTRIWCADTNGTIVATIRPKAIRWTTS